MCRRSLLFSVLQNLVRVILWGHRSVCEMDLGFHLA